MRAVSGRKARKAPKTQGAPPAPWMADIALKSRARLMGRSVMVMELMVAVSQSEFSAQWGSRRRPPPRRKRDQRRVGTPKPKNSSRPTFVAEFELLAYWL